MRLSSEPSEEIKLNMTAMIDIVFQLLVFFIMTFKVVTLEGDFNVKMPMPDTANEEIKVFPEVIYVTMTAGTNGNINSIAVDDEAAYSDPNDMYKRLTNYVETRIAAERDPEEANETGVEVEFDISPELKYRYAVEGIGAVSGKVQPDGTVKKLIEKIKFKDSSS